MFKLPVSHLDKFFSAVNGEMALYLPIESDGLVQFNPFTPGADVRLDKLNTVRSPKDFFFPHTEDIAAFKTRKKEVMIEDIQSPAEPFALFGVRACDAYSLELLDLIFLSDPADTFYESRRKSGIIITAACFEPEESCFCGTFNIDATSPGGDIATWLVGDTLYLKCMTKRGNELIEKVNGLLSSTGREDEVVISKHESKAKEIFSKLPFAGINPDIFTPGVMMKRFNATQWAKLHSACIGCGTCTFICPTCHCYDIQDFNTGCKIIRSRCWDSCMYSDFTLMAHGNPRPSRLERFRQRFMHKLIYFPENHNGAYACTGCGRCVKKCPISMNIVKVINALEVEDNVQ